MFFCGCFFVIAIGKKHPTISSQKTYSPVYSKVCCPGWCDSLKHSKPLVLQLTAVCLNRLTSCILLSHWLGLLFWQSWKREPFFSYFGPLKWKSILDKIVICIVFKYFHLVFNVSDNWVLRKMEIVKDGKSIFPLKTNKAFWNSLKLKHKTTAWQVFSYEHQNNYFFIEGTYG